MASITGPASVEFPFNSIMYLGQDFGSLGKYPPKERPYELNNVATWRFLSTRLQNAQIPGELGFYTNALLGLRRKGPNDGPNPCLSNKKYVSMCQEFLSFQIGLQDPKLIVIFSSVESSIYSPLFTHVETVSQDWGIKIVKCHDKERVIIVTPHPRSDSGVITKNLDNYKRRCLGLAEAWNYSNRP